MKSRDRLFVFLPVTLLLGVGITIFLLITQYLTFERNHLTEAQTSLAAQTQFISTLLLPKLRENQIDRVREYISFFYGKPFRVTVVDAEGTVVADSDADIHTLANHADRPEIAASQPESFALRWSDTMHDQLIYHAIREEGWIIRASMPVSISKEALSEVKQTVAFAILFGAGLAAALGLYLLLRVRPPFIALQSAATDIAAGKLDRMIHVPAGGPLRELSQAVATMGKQLKSRIDELAHERNEFDALFNTLREPLLVINASGRILQANRAATHLFGREVSRPDFSLNRIDCPPLLEYVETAFAEVVHSREIEFNDHGTRRALLARAVRMIRDDHLCLLLSLTDLTDLRTLERFRSDFIANVSHEIKTPLTAILSTVEMLTEMELDEVTGKKCLKILGKQSTRLNALVQDILSLAAIERRQAAPKKALEPCLLPEILSTAAALCDDEAERRGITLTLREPIPDIQITGDVRLLEQSLVNLMTNAFRHADATEVELCATESGSSVILSVRDNGCGIEAVHLPRLFERFYRVSKDRSRENGGTGLGLAIVKHTALLHQGRVEVDSTPGKGTEFRLILPR